MKNASTPTPSPTTAISHSRERDSAAFAGCIECTGNVSGGSLGWEATARCPSSSTHCGTPCIANSSPAYRISTKRRPMSIPIPCFIFHAGRNAMLQRRPRQANNVALIRYMWPKKSSPIFHLLAMSVWVMSLRKASFRSLRHLFDVLLCSEGVQTLLQTQRLSLLVLVERYAAVQQTCQSLARVVVLLSVRSPTRHKKDSGRP